MGQLKADFFWRDPYKNEVDIVLGDRRPIPVEVKYGRVDMGGLRAFMDRFRVRRGNIVTRDLEEIRTLGDKRISLVPASKAVLHPRKLLFVAERFGRAGVESLGAAGAPFELEDRGVLCTAAEALDSREVTTVFDAVHPSDAFHRGSSPHRG